MTFSISVGPNLRKSPYFDATVADGVKSFSVYNHMYIPAHFGKPELEYRELIEGVVMWDVGAQRQVEISGPDAASLLQYLSARDIGGTRPGQGRYLPVCDHQGRLINDPVMLMLAPDRFWLSIADSDIELWASAIAAERGYDVVVAEADASPLAVQGPKAAALIASLFGDWINELKYFGFEATRLGDIPLLLARSGWSKQGGFELYLQDSARGNELWQRVKQAGAGYGILPGAPNDIERIESGLLSYGADARLQVHPANPFELGLGRLVDLDGDREFVGKQALLAIKSAGITRALGGFFCDGAAVTGNQHVLPIVCEDEAVGHISEIAWSPRLDRNIALGLLATGLADSASLAVRIGGESRRLIPTSLPFIKPPI
jgi:aminomethyltransferase